MFLSSAFDVVNHWTEATIVVVVAIDRPTTMDLVMQLPNKTVTSYVVNSFIGGMDNLGIDNAVLRSDQEIVCDMLLKKIRQKRNKKTRVQFAPRYSSQSRGAVETHIKLVQGRPTTEFG